MKDFCVKSKFISKHVHFILILGFFFDLNCHISGVLATPFKIKFEIQLV